MYSLIKKGGVWFDLTNNNGSHWLVYVWTMDKI